MAQTLNIKKTGILILTIAVLTPLFLNALAYFNVIDWTPFTISIMTMLAAIFVLVEIPAMWVFKNIRIAGALSIMGVVIAFFVLIGGAISLSPAVTISPAIGGALGFANILLMIFVIREALREGK